MIGVVGKLACEIEAKPLQASNFQPTFGVLLQ